MTFRAGDSVRVASVGETWVLACDEEDGRVVCAGWPESVVAAAECELVEAASDEARLKMLRGCANHDGYRGRWARRQLAAAIVQALVRAIEQQARAVGLERIVPAAVAAWTPRDWQPFAELAGVGVPDQLTINEVVRVLRERSDSHKQAASP